MEKTSQVLCQCVRTEIREETRAPNRIRSCNPSVTFVRDNAHTQRCHWVIRVWCLVCEKYDNGLFIVKSRKLSEVHQYVGKTEHLLHESWFKPTNFSVQITPPSVRLCFLGILVGLIKKLLHM
jgi:hypothetical protein